MTPDLPIEFTVEGTAVSLQASARTRNTWKAVVRAAGAAARPSGSWALTDRVAVTIFYFPESQMAGDVDNIIKPILDALCNMIYVDDDQVERVLVQKFEPGNIFSFSDPSPLLAAALAANRSTVYIKITDDPHEELR